MTFREEVQQVAAQYPDSRSATSVPRAHVGVASSAANDGARKWMRHGFEPPCETT